MYYKGINYKTFLFLLPTILFSATLGFIATQCVSGLSSVLVFSTIFIATIPLSASSSTFLLGLFVRYLACPDIQIKANPDNTKMAVLIPCYGEDLEEVLLRVDSMRSSFPPNSINTQDQYTFFIASDTQDPDRILNEERIIKRWHSRNSLHIQNQENYPLPKLIYQKRKGNTRRKVGNIENWIHQWKEHYDYVTILDADSVVSGEWIVKAHQILSSDPKLGLVQAMLITAGRGSLHARLAQFSSRLCGPIWSLGSSFWFGSCANYWGHNAAIRITALQDARLPNLKNGNTYMSHDIVEAALLCGAGWKIILDPIEEGSWEETPTDACAEATREIRWCEGNLQHLQIIGNKGLKITSRIHLGLGILQYCTSPLFLLTALIIGMFPSYDYLYYLLNLAIGISTLIILPRIVGSIDNIIRNKAQEFGGISLLLTGTILSMVWSVVQVPLGAISGSLMMWTVLMGKKKGWNPQNRRGEVYSLQVAAKDGIVPSLLLLALLWWLALPWLAVFSIAALSYCTALMVTPMSRPNRTLVEKARLWDTKDSLNPSPILRQYLLLREEQEGWQEDEMVELEKLAAD